MHSFREPHWPAVAFVGAGHPESLTAALERRFLSTGQPDRSYAGLCSRAGRWKNSRAQSLAHPGLLRRVIGGHWGLAPRLGQMLWPARSKRITFHRESFCHLLRDIAAGRPGCVTHVGLGTFIDPLHGGGKLNDRTKEDLVERVQLRDRTWLLYHSFPVHVGLIRATAADRLEIW